MRPFRPPPWFWVWPLLFRRENRSRSRRGGKVGISRFGRDFQGSVGAGENLLLVFHGFHAPAFSTALGVAFTDQRHSLTVEPPHHVGAVTDRNRLIQVLMDRYRAPGQSATEPGLFNLPAAVRNRNRVVLVNHSLRLHREDPVQVAPAGAPKCGTLLHRRYLELAVKLRDVLLSQKRIGALYRRNAASRSSCGNRPCQVPKLPSDRPRAWGEYAAIICIPSSFIARPTCVKRCFSTFAPSLTVTKK